MDGQTGPDGSDRDRVRNQDSSADTAIAVARSSVDSSPAITVHPHHALSRPWRVRNHKGASLGLVAIVAALLRLPAVQFGLPYIWNPDEPTNLRIAGRMVDKGSVNPHFFNYPSLLYYVIAGAGWVQRTFGRWHLSAGLALPRTLENEGINRTTDPHLIIVLRLVTVLLSIGTCMVAWSLGYVVTKRCWAATLAGLMLAVSPLMVANGVLVTPDTYAAFFAAVALLAAVRLMRSGQRRDYVIAGAAVGLAAGSKYDAVAVAVAVIAAHLLRYPEAKELMASGANPSGHGVSLQRWARQAAPLVVGALASVIAFLLTTPEAVFDFHQFLSGALEPLHLYSAGFFPGERGSSLAFYLRTLDGQGLIFPVLTGVGLLGLFGQWWRESLVLATVVVSYGWLISAQVVYFDRNLLVELPALVVLAAIGVATIADRIRSLRWARIWVFAGIALIVAGLVPPLVVSARLPALLNDHPRAEAQTWISRHVPAGSTVVVEVYGPWIDRKKYRLVVARYLLDEPAVLPATADAVVLTEMGSGRFLGDPRGFPTEAAFYRHLTHQLCLGASYTDGPWIRIFVNCSK